MLRQSNESVPICCTFVALPKHDGLKQGTCKETCPWCCCHAAQLQRSHDAVICFVLARSLPFRPKVWRVVIRFVKDAVVTWPEWQKTSCQLGPSQICTPAPVPGTTFPACWRTLGRYPRGGAAPRAGRPHPSNVQKPLRLPVQAPGFFRSHKSVAASSSLP